MAVPSHGRWNLTQQALDGLLAKLAEGGEAAAREYEAIRLRLIGFFDRRGAVSADVLADETIDRVARKLEQGEDVGHMRAYFYGVAKRVWMEARREQARERIMTGDEFGPRLELADAEAQAVCFERCLQELSPASRELILGYYEGPGRVHLEGRKLLAQRLGLTYATLRTRARRIRSQLEDCLRTCLQNGVQGNK
jgi:DNA-directed RNA polymerase specialized sigma24 family protein